MPTSTLFYDSRVYPAPHARLQAAIVTATAPRVDLGDTFEFPRAPIDADSHGSGPIAPIAPITIPHTPAGTIGAQFITAGHAVFTLQGREHRFTYQVTRKDPELGSRFTEPAYFVALLTGPDNTSDYTYLGMLDARTGSVRLTKASRYTDETAAVKAIRWALAIVWQGRALPAPAAIFHMGQCGRCGRRLTTPESIARGLGPECAGKVGM